MNRSCNDACRDTDADAILLDLRCISGSLQTLILDVDSMKCGGCSASVKRILMAKPEVHSAAVNLLTECAVVRYSDQHGDGVSKEIMDALTSKVHK